MRAVGWLLALAACGNTSTPAGLDDTAGAGACPAFDLASHEVTLAPAGSAEVEVVGCGEAFVGTCPSWASMMLPDPAVPGDVATFQALPGWSGPREDVCAVTPAGGAEVRVTVRLE